MVLKNKHRLPVKFDTGHLETQGKLFCFTFSSKKKIFFVIFTRGLQINFLGTPLEFIEDVISKLCNTTLHAFCSGPRISDC